MEGAESLSRTDLDSHANMPVIGKHCLIINTLDEVAHVNAYSPEYEPMDIPIVDAAIKYNCPYDGIARYLIVRNALHVPSMDHNLIAPFILREKGLTVNEIPKIQVKVPTASDHAITMEDGFRIPLLLDGIFSYFPHSKPTAAELDETEELYLLTPENFDPHNRSYSKNEEAMLNWKGEVLEAKDRQQFLLPDIPDDATLSAAMMISSIEEAAINERFGKNDVEEQVPELQDPYGIDGVSMTSAAIYTKLKDQSDVGNFMAAIGSTAAHHSKFLFEDLTLDEADDSPTDSEEARTTDQDLDELLELSDAGYIDLDSIMAQVSAMSNLKTSKIDAEHLSKVWKISHEEAKNTLHATTQMSQRTQNPTLARNYETNDRMLRYKRLNEYFFMDTFFATKKAGKSSRGHTCCQLFVTDKGYVYVVPMKSKKEVPLAVKQFAKDVGAPDAIICDAAPEQKSEQLKKFLQSIGTTLRVLEEGTPWANRAELYIGLIKKAVLKDMKDSHCPLAFWDYCVERRARINNLTARPLFQLHGTTPEQAVTGNEGDISNLCRYDWYEWCYFREQKAGFPFLKEQLGRVLGPARGEGNELCQWILKSNGNVVPRRTHRPLSVAETYSEKEKELRMIFDQLIERRYGTTLSPPKPSKPSDEDDEWSPWDSEEEPARLIPDIEDAVDATGKVINQQPAYDKFINNEVRVPMGDEFTFGKVVRRSLDDEGKVQGRYDDNPILNSIVYDVEFPDGQVKAYAANAIADNLWHHADTDGYSNSTIEAIVDHKVDWTTAVRKEEKYVTIKSGQKRLRQTTKGWKYLIRWTDGKETWVPLVHVKESHPVQAAEYAQAHGLVDEAAFAWWVPFTIRKRDAIIAKVQKRLRRTNRKYGVELPSSVAHAKRLDEENGNTLWLDALKKEMQNVGIAFEILEAAEKAPPGWRKASGHLIWDCKMDFTRKARWVLDGHKQPNPAISTYAGVVSRESVRIAFTYAALNGLDVCAADIQNAYLQSPSSQKDYIICGEEFGLENVGKVALIRRALYGGKSAGRDFRNHLRTCMFHLGFQPCVADPDVWMRPALKSNGTEYYEYILLWTDDALCVSENAEDVLRKQLGKYFTLKESSIGKPTIYLGGRCREVELDNGVKCCWAFGSSQYVHAAIKNIEEELQKRKARGDSKYSLPSNVKSPLPATYAPELDDTPELSPDDASYYLSLIGILRWIDELGRIDITLEASMMASHSALPREGHLQAVLRIFGYLKSHHNAEQVYDPSDPAIDETKFERRDWTTSEFGHLEKEELPENMPQPRGFGFVTRANVDADHASDTITRKSRSGFIIWLNCAPIYWTSKKQTSVESSSFGSEFIAMKQCCEYIRGLRYKLRMMGIPVVGPTYIYGDNQSVLANTTVPESTLKKKSQSIAYHLVREGCARDEWRTTYVNTHDNEADLLTKILPSGAKRESFVRKLLHHVFAIRAGTKRKVQWNV